LLDDRAGRQVAQELGLPKMGSAEVRESAIEPKAQRIEDSIAAQVDINFMEMSPQQFNSEQSPLLLIEFLDDDQISLFSTSVEDLEWDIENA